MHQIARNFGWCNVILCHGSKAGVDMFTAVRRWRIQNMGSLTGDNLKQNCAQQVHVAAMIDIGHWITGHLRSHVVRSPATLSVRKR